MEVFEFVQRNSYGCSVHSIEYVMNEGFEAKKNQAELMIVGVLYQLLIQRYWEMRVSMLEKNLRNVLYFLL